MRILRHKPASLPEAEDPDALLVAWAQQNPRAFTALYDRYCDAVYGYCLGQLGDAQAAEDAASQTFLKALAALPGYRESGRFRSWLFAIAHNAILDALRARTSHVSLETASTIHDPAASPEDQVIVGLDGAWLDAAIARLPPSDRQVLELRRAGLRGAEIAAVLGISHEAAKKRQLRAIDQIRADVGVDAGNLEVRRGA
jgi:RNA polymerase sigma-70 factor (ECF subfamily)